LRISSIASFIFRDGYFYVVTRGGERNKNDFVVDMTNTLTPIGEGFNPGGLHGSRFQWFILAKSRQTGLLGIFHV